MDLVLGAFAVLLIVLIAETTPFRLTSQRELALIVVASGGVACLLFDNIDRWSIVNGMAIAGVAVALRAVYRLLRAWADDQEILALLRLRRR